MSDARDKIVEMFNSKAKKTISSLYEGYERKFWSQLPNNPTASEYSSQLEKIITEYDDRISNYKNSIKKNDWEIETRGLKIRPEHWRKVDSYIEEMRNEWIKKFRYSFS
jgi:flagellar biosynthesis chaperone FliJ